MREFNWDNVEESKFVDKEGTYTLTVVGITKDDDGNVTQTTTTGKEYHKYLCETEDKEKIFLTLYLIDNAMWKYKAFVKALGLNASGVVDVDTLPNTIIGKKFIGQIKRQAPKMNIVTGVMEESKYFEIAKFYSVTESIS